ncbi:copper-translocating P-type ATPase [Vibrio amylolyticus]|uniref:heavy metal translocating P-type ATPase n=1 Tax=Vibrio amylolyticus TaxID=2847292 RepID=UPI003553F650
MNKFEIPLSGLNCMGCARKVEQAIVQNYGSHIHHLTSEVIDLETNASYKELYSIIQDLGYEAGYTYHYRLSGLSCQKCVKKLTDLLDQQDSVSSFSISLDTLRVNTLTNSHAIIKWVESLNFQAIPIKEEISASPNPTSTFSDTKTHQNSNTDSFKDAVHPTTNSTIEPAVTEAIHLLISGMTCASCVSSVEKAFRTLPEVKNVQINLAEQSAIIEVGQSTPSTLENILQSAKEAGYPAELSDDPQTAQEKQRQQLEKSKQSHKLASIYALLLGGPLMVWGMFGGNMMIRHTGDQYAWGVIGFLCLLLMSTSGRSFYINAYQAFTHRRATMDSLVSLGTGAAWIYSMLMVLLPSAFPESARHVYFEATAMILGLISLGHYIEAKAKAKTTQSLQALINLQPQSATVITESGDQETKLSLVEKGMKLRIRPGEKIPVDGIVITGHSFVDESMLTGEPIPVAKEPNNELSAGTLNQDGSLTMEATGVGQQTMLARIIQMVRRAQSSKPEIAKMVDHVASIFVPIVIAIALLATTIWYFVGPEPKLSYMLIVATTVLIIACPCALGLATPLSITVGVGKAAEMGILIKDADALQTASNITTVVFDKTGTLTQGKPQVQHVFSFGIEEEKLLQYAYSAELHSEHPLAKSICLFAQEKSIIALQTDGFINLKGKGVELQCDGHTLMVSSLAHLEFLNIATHNANSAIEQCHQNAWTPIAITLDNTLIGIIAISDTIKPSAKSAIAELKKRNITTVMLTGDNESVAQAIAEELNIDKVIAQVLPDEKAQHIIELQKNGATVAMVGDGVNDAPALAQAELGIAMGCGSDVAIESAQMTLLNSSPLAVINAIDLSKATVTNIKQNLFGAFIYNSLGIPIAAGVLFPAFGFLLSPVVAGAAMALSSITVVSNANRLRLFKSKLNQ